MKGKDRKRKKMPSKFKYIANYISFFQKQLKKIL